VLDQQGVLDRRIVNSSEPLDGQKGLVDWQVVR